MKTDNKMIFEIEPEMLCKSLAKRFQGIIFGY